ncbi:NAD(P)-binding protein [Clathrospora elynae]|uniref:NAD(P)-binding protein n=1 Tax=Clathrospora elynae TaxID=706981 RepID=A0A6A5SLA2_9PLEO|nr:NAD(P)-binding protein [Clathrospora elynae]
MPTAVIAGANSGIGYALAQILVKEGYKALGCESIRLDTASPDSIASFAKLIGDQQIDLLLNVAGVMLPHDADTLETVDTAKFQKTFAVNTFGPLLLTQALLPNIFKSSHPRIAVMSSRVGSMGDNSSGGMYAYRSSKAAVNSLFKSMAIDLRDKNVPVILLHSGIVKTNLGPRNKEGNVPGAVQPEHAAAELWKVLM